MSEEKASGAVVPAPPQQKELPLAIEELQQQAQAFRELYNVLEDKLRPILHPEDLGEAKIAQPISEKAEPVRFSERLGSTISMNQRTIHRFGAMLDRFDY